jgi:signal transduction histidine kinase/CheY-like chemotaxis protein
VTVAGASGFAYAGTFLAVHARFDYEPMALTAMPLVAGGLLFGVRGGFIAWLLVIPLNVVLHVMVGLQPTLFVGEGPVRAAVALGVGLVVGRLRDLTLARRAEAESRQAEAVQRERAEAQLRVTIAAIPDLILRITRDGRLIDFHAGSSDDLHALVDGSRGKKLCDIVAPACKEKIIPALAETLGSGLPQVTEYRLSTTEGQRDYETRVVAAGEGEALAIVRDVTDRKRLEDVLRQAEADRVQAKVKDQLMMADRQVALGTLAAGAAHEINNPLAYVMGNLGFLAEELERLEPGAVTGGAHLTTAQIAEMREMVREALEGAERVRLIVRDLQTFARAEGEATEVVDVGAQLENAIKMAKKEIAQRAALVRDYQDVAPVNANPGRLGQVFLNLILNAAQAIPEGAPDANEVRVVSRMNGSDTVLVEVHDTGCGISPVARQHLFEPFFTTKPIGVGSGLGLYICKNLVTAIGGTIRAEDGATRGSVFQVRLPAAPPKLLDATASPAAEHPASRGRVLVVDDEPAVAKAVSRTLASEHDVVVVSSAKDALARIGSGERFDVILCDLMMPQMTGMDLYAELSRQDPPQSDRMIFLSGGAFSAAARAFLQHIPNARIDKPFNANALRALVRDRISK